MDVMSQTSELQPSDPVICCEEDINNLTHKIHVAGNQGYTEEHLIVKWAQCLNILIMIIIIYLLTESEVFTGRTN